MNETLLKENTQRAGKRVTAASLVVAVLFSLMWIAMGSQIAVGAKQRDFLNLYVGAQMAADGEFARLHDQRLQLEYERRLFPETAELWPFVRPHFYAVLLIPLSWLPFGSAFVAWIVVQSALLLGCWAWAARRFGEDALILGSMYLPTAIGIANGQDCVLLLVIVIAAYCLAERRRDFLAGAVVALTLAKFHLLLLLPVAMLFAGRKRIFAGYVAAGSLLVGVSMALAGPEGVATYAHMLTDPTLSGLHPAPQKIISIQSFQWNFLGKDYLPVSVTLAVGVAALCWTAARRAPLWRWWTAGCLASLLAVPHVYAYDAGFFLLGIWLTLVHAKAAMTRIIAGILAAPLVFFLSFVQSEYALMFAPAATLLALLVAIAVEGARLSGPTAPA